MSTDTDQAFNLDRLRNALRAKSRQHGDVKLFRHVKGELFAGKLFVGTDQACFINSSAYRFDSVLIQGAEFTVDGPCDWGLQLYNVADLVVRHSYFHDFMAPKLDGHAAYIRADGNVTFEHGLTQRCFGQGVQSAKRGAHHGGHESLDVSKFSEPSVFRIADWTFEDCSIPGGKHSGFVLSFFGFQDDSGSDPSTWPTIGQRVELVDVRMRHSIGGVQLLVQGGRFGHPAAFLSGCDFDYPDTEGRGEIALLKFVPQLIAVDGNANGGTWKVYVKPGDEVSIHGWSGNAPLWVYEHELDDKGALRQKTLHKLSMREGFSFGKATTAAAAAGGKP